MHRKIAVVGAGINGLASAVKIKEKYKDLAVVLISKEFWPNTTGDGSGGLWYPYYCGSTPEDLLGRWGDETYKYYHSLWLGGEHGICLMPVYYLYRKWEDRTTPAWTDHVFGFEHLTNKQLQYFSHLYSVHFVQGHTFTTFVAPPSKVLSSLQKRFVQAGGSVLQAEVTSLSDAILDPFDIVVNCTGVKAREIVPDDRVIPIRGQVMRVKADWVMQTIFDSDKENHYIIPNDETVVLGGTHQKNNFNTDTDEGDKKFIWNGCTNDLPGLKNAEIVRHWAGLRPGRDEGVRLEAEERHGKLFIHNYGHGGSGLTLFWGCATDVLRVLDENIKNTMTNKASKL